MTRFSPSSLKPVEVQTFVFSTFSHSSLSNYGNARAMLGSTVCVVALPTSDAPSPFNATESPKDAKQEKLATLVRSTLLRMPPLPSFLA